MHHYQHVKDLLEIHPKLIKELLLCREILMKEIEVIDEKMKDYEDTLKAAYSRGFQNKILK